MRQLTTNDKKQILATFIESLVCNGFNIKPYIYKPLSHWNYETLIKETIKNYTDGQGWDQDTCKEYENEYFTTQPEIKNPTMEIYESKQKERNLEKYGHGHGCICCGKPMTDYGTDYEKTYIEQYHIHMNIGGDAVHPTISDEDCEKLTGYESQGCFPIGNDCAKKMKGFAYKFDENDKMVIM